MIRSLALLLALTAATAATAAEGTLLLRVLDRATGEPVPCRVHLTDPAGKPHRPPGLPFWHDHFVCEGSAELRLPTGRYRYEVERGPEYSAARGTVEVTEGEQSLRLELGRVADLAREGWWGGDLHVHRPVRDVPLLMRAEDLHVAPVITWWNDRNHWGGQARLPEEPLVRFDGNRFYHLMAGEDERGGGALLYFNLPRPLPIAGSAREHPSSVKFLREARRVKGAHVDIEKPFWWDVPLWLAEGGADSIGLANNHMCRDRMYESEAWGRPRDAERLPPPRGNGYWSQEIYYHVLNGGLRLPPSAGSASGVLPNPLGYNRVYAHVGGELTYEKWWEALRAGRSFVTNGPLLRVRANGRLPGHVFAAGEGETVELGLEVRLTTRDPIKVVEVIKDGRVERAVPYEEVAKTGSLGKVRFGRSGWLLVRTIADDPRTFRFASTAPFYVEIGGKKRPVSRESARFFLDWVEERGRRLQELPDAGERKAVLEHVEAARRFWQERLREARE